MRVVVAPDKFRGTLTAREAARAMATGWRRADPRAEVRELPVADGGEGTLVTLVGALDGELMAERVTGPLGDPVEATYGVVHTSTGVLAVVEMAQASGLRRLSERRRDPLRATTRGTGELIRAACWLRPARLVVAVGGSATNDAGAGMAQALGIRLLDERGEELPPGGAALRRLAAIDTTGLDRLVRDVEVVVAADVDNPLLGPNGASAMYGPQKGASPEDVARLDEALAHFAAVVHRDLGIDLRELRGGGAAGGLGAGLVAFVGARLRAGFDVVSEALDLPRHLEWADVAITGEGRYDRNSVRGKAPQGVLRLAREAWCRTVLVAGDIEDGIHPPADMAYSLVARAGADASMARARELLEDAAAEAAEAMREEA